MTTGGRSSGQRSVPDVCVAVAVDLPFAVEQAAAVARHGAVAVRWLSTVVVVGGALVFTGTGSGAAVDGGRSLEVVAVAASHSDRPIRTDRRSSSTVISAAGECSLS